MPVTRPALVHDFGSDLGLEEQGGVADYLHDEPHPAVFFFGQPAGVLEQVKVNVWIMVRLGVHMFFE